MMPRGGETGRRSAAIDRALGTWAKRDGRGFAFGATGFVLPNGTLRSPTAAWVARARWCALCREDREGYAPICPDFAIELGPNDPNMREYVEQGAALAWWIDPQSKSVHIYRPRMPPLHRTNADRVEADPVLPGFALELSEIW